MSRKLLKEWLPSRHKARELESLQAFKHLFDRPEIWSLTRYSVARAVAIGLFSAFIPLPMQMLISGTLAVIFRANLLISVAMVWITNPLTMAPLFYFCYRIGLLVLSEPVQSFANLGHEWTFTGVIKGLDHIWQPLFLGLGIVGITCTVLGYYGVLLFWRLSVSLSWKARKRRHK